MNSIKDWLAGAFAKASTVKISGMPLKLVYGLILAWAFLFALFVCAFCVNWYTSGRAELSALNSFLTTNIGPAAIAAVTFLIKAVQDDDGDGVPDEFEQKGDKEQ